MSRYLRSYLIGLVVLFGACVIGLLSIGVYDLNPRNRLLVLIATALAIGGWTKLFWVGRRDGD